MQAKPKSNSVITTRLIPETGVIEFTVLRAGPLSEGGIATPATLFLDPAKCSEKVRARAMVHGLTARIVDKAALPCDTKTGKSASPMDKLAAMRVLVDHYMSGAEGWSPEREARVGKGPGLDATLLSAVVEGTGRSEAEILEMVKRGAEKHGVGPDTYLSRLASAKAISPIVARLREEAGRAAAFDADAELEAAMEGEKEEQGEVTGD